MSLEQLKDARPPVALPSSGYLFWIMVGSILAVLLIVLVYGLTKRNRSTTALSVVPLASWEFARKEMAALAQDNLPSRGKGEEFFVRLSGIIRCYLERRFSVSAPEMTTDEFLLDIEKKPYLSKQQKLVLKEFLGLSDMVKFARYRSSENEMSNAFTTANRLIDETIPAEETISGKS